MLNVQEFKIDTNEVNPISISLLQGEAVEFRFLLYKDGTKITAISSAEVYYRHDDMEEGEWYKSTAQVSNGVVVWNWDNSLDVGARRYAWFVRAKGSGAMDVSYRALGKFNMLKSPNFTPNELELPAKVLDFATIEVLNAPYYTKSQMDSEIDAIDLRLQGHDEEIDALREEITGDAEETLKQHEENYNNPHRVKASQLTEKSPTAGSLNIVFNDENQGLSGSFNFGFDPSMYNEGALSFSLNVGEYAPPPIASKTLSYNGNVHLAFFDNGNPVFVTESTIEGIYFYVSTIYITTTPESTTTKALLFFMIGGTQDAQSISDVTPFGDVLAQYATIHTYISSGTYQVITEAMLRDKVTGKAFTICVENGELKLQEYRATKYEA